MANILVSACLLGISCRYNGTSCRNETVLQLAREHTLIPVCPEQLGGLPTPRFPGERVKDRVMTAQGKDITEAFQKGAEAALKIAVLNQVEFAVLKSFSPSCGKGIIYDGTFSGNKTEGNGVAADLLIRHGIPVLTEKEL